MRLPRGLRPLAMTSLCRGHHDMRPLMDDYPAIERCSWDTPEYYELLRRGIRWALGTL